MSNTYNIDPYFDDFDATKNYVKVLFKPGIPVQARELNQLQTAIQEQIKAIGGFLFKNESLVLGGESQSFNVIYIDVISSDLSEYDDKTFISQTNNSKIKIISHKNNLSAGVSRLYFSYLNGNRIAPGEILVENVATPTVASLTVTNSSSNLGMAKAYRILESVFFVKDYFVVVAPQTIILSDSTTPTIKVGLRVSESISTYQDDETLLDPSSGTLNYAAPGADRVQISLDLIVSAYDPIAESEAEEMVDDTEDNFIELARFKYGILIKSLKNPNLGALDDVLAKRTFDESGNYTVKTFKAKVVNNVKKEPDLLSIAIEPGKAYVKGYEFETESSITIDVEKGRDYDTEQNTANEAAYGDYFIINNPTGQSIDYAGNIKIDLRDVGNTIIGSAYVPYIEAISSTQLKLFVTNLTINQGQSVSSVTNVNNAAWTAAVVATNPQKLYRGKKSPLLIQLRDTPIKTVYDTSYVSQINTYGTATSTTLSPTVALSAGKSYISTNILDYVIIKQSDGTRVSADSATVTGSSFTLTGTFTNGALYDVYAKISVTSEAKVKTRTATTVYITNTSSSKLGLGVSDVYKIVKITAKHSVNNTTPLDVTGRYTLDNGQRDSLYDYASLVLKRNTLPVNATTYDRLVVDIEYFIPGSNSGYFSIDSYDINNTNDELVVKYDGIPSYKMSSGEIVSLRDVIDFRPIRQAIASFPGNLATPIGSSPSAIIQGSEICQPGQFVTTDYEFYLPRIDKLIITKEKRFDMIRGVSAKNPSIPSDLPDAMTIYNVNIPAYTFSAKEVKLEYIENRRYTMRDIGKIDNRVSRIEYYTAMSLLEKQASDESLVNASGIDKFKNGILVDSFAGHGVGDVGSPDYSCSIDSVTRTLRPRFGKQTIEFDINRQETSSVNYSLTEQLLTLPYSTEVILSNSQATNWSDVQRYSTFSWEGEVKLSPSSDTWSDQTTLPDVVVNVNGNNDAFTVLADQVSNPASSGVKWADWQLVDKGIDISTSITNTDAVSTSLNSASRAIQATQTTTSTNVTTTVNDLYTASGIQVNSSAVSTITRDLGTKVVDASLIPFIRSRIVDFSAARLQPNTEVFVSFDDVEVTRFCVQAPVIYIQAITNATRVRKIGTSKAADIVLLRTNKAFIKMDAGQYLFAVGDTVEWFVNGSWIPGNSISDVISPPNDSLVTDEAGDLAGFFTIPAATFRTGERVFRIADDLGDRANTAAESKYVAMGLAMSLQKDVISTRVQTVSINPISKSTTNTTVTTATSTQVATVYRDVTVACGDTSSGYGSPGRYTYNIEFGTDIGACGINYDGTGIPDRYTIIWNGREYTSGFRGDSNYNYQLGMRGYPSTTTSIDSANPVTGKLRFEKSSIYPTTAQLIVDAPLPGTSWAWKIVCPGKTDNLLPETSPTLSVTVDTPAALTISYSGSRNAFTNVETLVPGPASVSYNFTVRVDGNQNVPNGTLVSINSLSRWELSTNGRFNSFSGGSTFTYNGRVVTLPLTMRTGETITINVSYDLSNFARSLTTTNNGTLRAPVCAVSASVSLQTAIDGYNASTSGQDTTTLGSSVAWAQDWTSAWQGSGGGCGADPLAQTFFVSSRENPDGIFVDSVDVFFKMKNEDEDAPVTVSIRPTVNGYPSSTGVLPLATATKYSRDISVSVPDAAKIPTNFKFQGPIFLSPDTEYAIVVASPVTGFQLYISRIGELLLGNQAARSTKQPLSGSMFYSSNGYTWTAEQTDDLCMRVRKCVFPTNTQRPVILNASLSPSQKQASSIDYDTLFIDGEILDFSSTNVDYFVKTSLISGSTFSKESVWTPYQLGSNVVMKNRKSLNPLDETTLRVRCMLSTTNRDISPVVDLSRISGALVQNIINSNTASEMMDTTATITNVEATTIAATITTSGAHGFVANDYVMVNSSVNNTVNGFFKIASVPTSTTFTYSLTGDAITSQADTGTVIRKGQALSRYITRKVTLNAGFYSDDLRVYYYANIPAGCSIVPYYRVTSLTDPILEDNAWVPMTLEESGALTSTGYKEFKFKPPYVVNDDVFALSTAEQFGTFSVKLVMTSTDTTRVPLVKDLRVLAVSN